MGEMQNTLNSCKFFCDPVRSIALFFKEMSNLYSFGCTCQVVSEKKINILFLIQIRVEIQKAKLQLLFELQRMPTDEEIIERVRLSPERYHEVMKVSKPVFSLHARHMTTQEEFINGITDVDGVDGVKRKQPALLRLALDDVVMFCPLCLYVWC